MDLCFPVLFNAVTHHTVYYDFLQGHHHMFSIESYDTL